MLKTSKKSKKDFSEKETKNQGNLEKILSIGHNIFNTARKKGRIFSIGAGISLATLMPFNAENAFAEWQTIYKKSFNLPVYSEQFVTATKTDPLLSKDIEIKIKKDSETDKLKINITPEDFDEKKEYPEAETYLNASHSHPLIIHSSNLEVSEIEQKAYINTGEKGYWSDLIPPEENIKLQKGIELEKKVLTKLIGLMGVKIDDRTKEHLEKFWEMFVIEQRERNREKTLRETDKIGYELTKINPFTHNRVSGKERETAREFYISFEQDSPLKENIWIIQGAALKKDYNPRAFGSLEKQIIGPISIGKELEKINPEEIERINLWSLKEGKNFDWLKRDYYDLLKIKNPDSKKTNYEVISICERWSSENEEIYSMMPSIKIGKNIMDMKITNPQTGEIKEISGADLSLPAVKSWGSLKIEKIMFPVFEEMNRKHTKEEDWFSVKTKLGKGKGELAGRYLGQISFDEFYQGLQRAKSWGEFGVYTIKRRGDELFPAKLSEWKKDNNGINTIRFLTRESFNKLEDFGFGIFPVLDGKIKGEPIYYTDNIREFLYKEKDQNIKFEKLKITNGEEIKISKNKKLLLEYEKLK